MTAAWIAHRIIPGEHELFPLGVRSARPRARVWIGLHTGGVFWCVFDRHGAPAEPPKTEATNEKHARRAAEMRLIDMLEAEAAEALSGWLLKDGPNVCKPCRRRLAVLEGVDPLQVALPLARPEGAQLAPWAPVRP